MSEKSSDFAPTVVIRVADEAGVRRVGELLATLHSANSGVLATCDAEIDCDCELPASAADDVLRATVALAVKLATARRHLTAAMQNEGRLAELAATDPLTGLANRRAWDAALERETRNSATYGTPLCTAILDIDLFKSVNDRHGHSVGDAVLRATAEGLRSALRRGDTAARIGGDEFGLLLPGLQPEHAATVVERIRRSIAEAIAEAGLPPTTCSAGYAVDASNAYIAASSALQQAKQAGRDRSVAAAADYDSPAS